MTCDVVCKVIAMLSLLIQCPFVLQDFEQACVHLSELVEEYEPELMRLLGNAPKYALAQAVQVSCISLIGVLAQQPPPPPEGILPFATAAG